MLTVNFSSVFLVIALTLLGYPLPLLPLQILWLNMVADSFPAFTIILEKGEKVMKSKPRKENPSM